MILILKNSSIDLIVAKFRELSIWSVCFLSYSYLLFLDFFPFTPYTPSSTKHPKLQSIISLRDISVPE